MKTKFIISSLCLILASNALASLQNAREVLTCTYHRGYHGVTLPASVKADEKHLYIVNQKNNHVLWKFRVSSKHVSDFGMTISYHSFWINPFLPITIFAGAWGGEQNLRFQYDKRTLTMDSYAAMAGEQTFERAVTCDKAQGDLELMSNLFPKKMRSIVTSTNAPPTKVTYIGDLPIVSDASSSLTEKSSGYSRCRLFVDQEDSWVGGESQGAISWDLQDTLINMATSCKTLSERFDRDYIKNLDVPPDMTKVELVYGYQNFVDRGLEQKYNGPSSVTVDSQINIVTPLASAMTTEIGTQTDSICRVMFRQQDYYAGGSARGNISWVVDGDKNQKILSCKALVSFFSKNYLEKLDNEATDINSYLFL